METQEIKTAEDAKASIKSYLPALIFYPLTIVFYELMLKFTDNYNSPWNASILTTVLFSISAGLLFCLIFTLIRPVILSRILSGITIAALWVLFCVEYDCNQFYKMYYGITYAAGMTGQVMGDFSSVVWSVALKYILQEAVFLIPLIVFIACSKWILPKKKYPVKLLPIILVPMLLLQIGASLNARFGEFGNVYTYDFAVCNSVPRIGLLNSFRLEIAYIITGTPDAPIEEDEFVVWTPENAEDGTAAGTVTDDLNNEISASNTNANITDSDGNSSDSETGNGGNTTGSEEGSLEEAEVPKEYAYNACVDFASLIENESNDRIKKMHEYFGSLEPSKQNEYTGIFEGKNLIFMSAEAFSPYAVDKDFSPTLYKLANEGFVFENYYQPSWSLSTTGGEFANMTGIIPEWIESGNSFTVSASKFMPYSLAGLLGERGYVCKAYHNNSFDYYDRNKTHPNLGYDYKGIGNGLVLEHRAWPNSDLEMLEATVPEMIEEFKETGIPFHTYYMTVSGHCHYNWGGNAMSKKNKEAAVEAFPDSSVAVQAYMACNLELDHACDYLLEELEKAGILEDTVICISADHYPYSMSQGKVDYYKELSGIDDTTRSVSRYKNTLILYCASMKEPVIVDTPCYSVDIVPTLDNLFNVEYDSRLYSGRDIFATNYEADKVSSAMPLVIVPIGNGYSFVTAAGTYDAAKKEFTPNEGIEVDDNYVKEVQDMIQKKWTYAKLLITNDYYAKVFPGKKEAQPEKPLQTEPKEQTDVNSEPEETLPPDNPEQPEENAQPEIPETVNQPEQVENTEQPESVETTE